MAELAYQHYVIMGKPRNRPGARGLVSTLSDINDMIRSGRSLAVAKEKMSIALGGWVAAKPDWKFDLVEVPQRHAFSTHNAYQDAIDALYI